MTRKRKPRTPKQKPLSGIEKRIAEQKALMIETLEKVPIIQVACKRIGIARATFYRWKEEDSDLGTSVTEAVHEV